MAKLLLFLVFIGVVYWWFRTKRSIPPASVQTRSTENMIRCVHCGVHLPQSEALGTDAAWFCSEAHQREHRN